MDYFPVKEEMPDSYTIEEEQEFETLQLNGETSETAEGINLLEHCVLCLRKLLIESTKNEEMSESISKPKRGRGRPLGTTKKRKHEKPVREADFSVSLTTFNHIWPYLNEKWKRKVGDDISSSSIKFVRKLSKDNYLNVTEVPPMCDKCGTKIEELDKLHQEITNKVLEIHSIITYSGPTGALSWRGSAFEQALENAADKSAVVLTKQFVDDLRTGCSLPADPLEDVDMGSEPQEDATFPADEEIKIEENHDGHELGSQLEIPLKKPGKGKKTRLPSKNLIKKKAKRPKRLQPRRQVICHRCDICNDWLPYTELEDHMRTHVQDYFVKCPNYKRCGYLCSNRLKLEKRHFKVYRKCRAVIGDGRYERECETCGFKTNNLKSYKLHVVTHETTDKHFPCPIKDCPRSFTVRPSVLLHLETHTYHKTRDVQFCESCKKKISVSDIEEHLKTVHNSTEVIRCTECQFVFIEREKLLNHMKLAHTVENIGFQCDICLDGKRHLSLRKHYYEVHNIGSKPVCEFCNKSFTSEHTLNAHRQRFHSKMHVQKPAKVKLAMLNLPKSKYSCKECEKELDSYSSLLIHEVKVHGADHFRCTVCSKSFATKAYLKDHERTTHDPDIVPLKCEIDGCGRTFVRESNLRQHMKRNHNPNPNPSKCTCDICGTVLKSLDILQRHKQIIHEQKEACVCETCGKSFITKYNLRLHMSVHSGEKPHQCEICGTNFRQKSVLDVHRKIHKNVK